MLRCSNTSPPDIQSLVESATRISERVLEIRKLTFGSILTGDFDRVKRRVKVTNRRVINIVHVAMSSEFVIEAVKGAQDLKGLARRVASNMHAGIVRAPGFLLFALSQLAAPAANVAHVVEVLLALGRRA